MSLDPDEFEAVTLSVNNSTIIKGIGINFDQKCTI